MPNTNGGKERGGEDIFTWRALLLESHAKWHLEVQGLSLFFLFLGGPKRKHMVSIHVLQYLNT